MPDVQPLTFEAFFEALWGKTPFSWQTRLAREVVAAQADGSTPSWPTAIALPTASGKTACIDIAVFALAMQAERIDAGRAPSAPRRIFFVVDRRVIVDEAFDRAQALAKKLADAKDGVLRDVARRLRRIGGVESESDGLPLAAQALRGGQPLSDDWAATPLQPTVVASTVDQVGSRLLFRGYGTSPGMWPVHAALVGNDSLILLDEAHCAQPMLQTLQAVCRWRGWAEQPLPAPFEVAVLSATPPVLDGDRIFRDDSPERRDPSHPLGQRQLASKPARLVLAEGAKGRDPAKVRAALAAKLAEQARELSGAGLGEGQPGAAAVVVFCNRVDTARRVHALLKSDGADAHLLTGRMRPIDKDDFFDGIKDRALAASQAHERSLQRPCFIVATQTLEVGADLDFDRLVTECASLDALRQRFGRLNRGGRPIDARAAIVAAAADLDDKADDPVYGGALRATWHALSQWAGGQQRVDFGIAAMEERLGGMAQADAAALDARARHAPTLLPAHLDALVQTAPIPQPSPDVALFLHGASSGPADVQVCWRADLDVDRPMAGIDALLRCPPSSPECLAVPFAQMRRWLDGGRDTVAGDAADVEGVVLDEERPDAVVDRDVRNATPRTVVRWRGRDASREIVGSAELRPGDVIVIPAGLGGFDELATLGACPVADWGDRARASMHPDAAVLRLHPALLATWPGSGGVANDAAQSTARPLDALVADGRALWEEDRIAFAKAMHAALSEAAATLLGDDDRRWGWLRSVVEGAVERLRRPQAIEPHPAGGWIVADIRLRRPARAGAAATSAATDAFFSDEDDAASSGHFRSLLGEHMQGVGGLAREYARRCGLPDEAIELLGRSGDWHDLGKADPRFQAWLNNGRPWLGAHLLAKSDAMPQGKLASRQAREQAGYPEGGRHELLSVRLLESCPQMLPADAAQRELLLHLVESHHGHCRPFAPVVVDDAPRDVTIEAGGQTLHASSATGLERVDAGPAERFWRMTRRHGWWGLAWLEAMLRLADHRRSEWEHRRAPS